MSASIFPYRVTCCGVSLEYPSRARSAGKSDAKRLFHGEKSLRYEVSGDQFERCSGGKGSNRRGTGEKREGREGAGEDRWREGFQHCDHCGGGRRSRSLDQMYGYVGRCAERAVGMGVGAVRVGMGDLHGAGNNDQKNAEQREEDSPRMRSAGSEAVMTHTRPLYRRVWDTCLGGRGWIETQTGRRACPVGGVRGAPAPPPRELPLHASAQGP